MSKRREAREIALQSIYQIDLGANDLRLTKESVIDGSSLGERNKDFAWQLVEGAWMNKDEIDNVIKKYVLNWPFERLAAIDKNILRIAIYELMNIKDIPVNVTINEAIELAKKYSTKDSGGFVNGILDKIKKSEKIVKK